MEELIQRSHVFYTQVQFPYRHLDNRLTQNSSLEMALETHPICHRAVERLMKQFLDHKRQYGTNIEQIFYQNITIEIFAERLLINRPVVFYSTQDLYLLSNGSDGAGGFESIGTNDEEELHLTEYLSYDEIKIAALISMSVPTVFINSGSRNNMGRRDRSTNYVTDGIYVGSVGARFEREGQMEWAHMLITPEQNTPENGYGFSADPVSSKTRLLSVFSEFYSPGSIFPSYDEIMHLKSSLSSEQFSQLYTDCSYRGHQPIYLNNLIYKQRMKYVIQSYLQEANQRAEETEKRKNSLSTTPSINIQVRGYVRPVGLGLGVWQIHSNQTHLYLESYEEVLKTVPLPYIEVIEFLWIGKPNTASCGGIKNGEFFTETAAGNPIRIFFTKNDPASLLIPPVESFECPPDRTIPIKGGEELQEPSKSIAENELEETTRRKEYLLIAQYAWDGNSYPGNEYWLGLLTASGDPAAACCSYISELQNPIINPDAFRYSRYQFYE